MSRASSDPADWLAALSTASDHLDDDDPVAALVHLVDRLRDGGEPDPSERLA